MTHDPLTPDEVLALDADDRWDYECALAGERRRRGERAMERYEEETKGHDDDRRTD